MKFLLIFPNNNALRPMTGSTVRSWNVAKSLINNNNEVSVLHSINAKGLEDKNLKEKCRIYYHKTPNIFALREKFFNDINPFFILKLFKILRKEKFDIIQLVSPFGLFILKLLSKRSDVLIYDSHGVEGEFVKVSLYEKRFPKYLFHVVRIYTRLYEKYACKLANYILTLSEADRKYYINKYNIDKNKTYVIQVPSAIDYDKEIVRSEDLINDHRKKLGLPLDKTIVVFHGSIPHPPNEEAINLIENFIAPKFIDTNIVFAIAGRNVKKYKKNNLFSLGFVEDLKDLLYSANFAIVPIINGEGMRVKCSDYILTGLPFISTKKGIEGIDFLTEGEDYLLYDTVNNDFIEGINVLYKDKSLRTKMNLNLKEKSHYLNKENIEKKFIELYSKINKEK